MSSDKPFRMSLRSNDLQAEPYQLTVERENDNPPDGLIEILDEALTSRAPTAQVAQINNRIYGTEEEMWWLLGALARALGCEEQGFDVAAIDNTDANTQIAIDEIRRLQAQRLALLSWCQQKAGEANACAERSGGEAMTFRQGEEVAFRAMAERLTKGGSP